MAIINNQGVFIAPDSGEGDGVTLTNFRNNDDFNVDFFDETFRIPNFPNNVGIALVRSSESPADYATISLRGNDTSRIYVNNTINNVDYAISGDVYIGYFDGTLGITSIFSQGNLYVNKDLRVNGFIYGRFNDITLNGTTRFGSNTIEIKDTDNSITGITSITANVGIISSLTGTHTINPVSDLTINGGIIGTSIQVQSGIITSLSGINTITPNTRLDIGGNLLVTGISTVGLASTSNPSVNNQFSFELASNTSLRVRVKCNDGVVRTGTITLA